MAPDAVAMGLLRKQLTDTFGNAAARASSRIGQLEQEQKKKKKKPVL